MKNTTRFIIIFVLVVVLVGIWFLIARGSSFGGERIVSEVTSEEITQCPSCGLKASGNFCSDCGYELALSFYSDEESEKLMEEWIRVANEQKELEKKVEEIRKNDLRYRISFGKKKIEELKNELRTFEGIESGKVPPEGMYLGRDGVYHYEDGDSRKFGRRK